MNIPRNGLIIGLSGPNLTTFDLKNIESEAVGGVILFKHNCQSVEQIQQLVDAIRSIRQDLWISIDQEGGRVQRIREPLTKLPPMSHFGSLYDSNEEHALEATTNAGELMASELKSLGIDLSFAPVVDLATNQTVIGDRAFHTSPDAVTALANAWVRGMAKAGMPSCIKHFPGHGTVHEDTHFDVGVSNAELSELTAVDLKPFLQVDAPLMMISHVVVPKVDVCSVSLSRIWLQDILRDQLGYKGLIVSDDVCMKGIEGPKKLSDRTNQAFAAGADIVLWCHQLEELQEYLEKATIMPSQNHIDMVNTLPKWDDYKVSKERQTLQERLQQFFAHTEAA